MARTTAREPLPRRLVRTGLVLGLLLALSGCGGEALTAPAAAERYPAIAEELADALGEQVAPLTSDENAPQVGADSEGCRVVGATFESADLLGDEGPGAPAAEQITEVADSVLTEHDFAPLAPEDGDPAPMESLVAEDDQGGTMRVVIESRPGRATLRLWWSAQVETDDAPCEQSLLG
jgi:hypothetical protein